jgi:phospho-N-acetylmuramoyl-pentapeptide-transferase
MILARMDAVLAALIPFAVSLALGKPYIQFLKTRYMGQYIREDGPESHQSKAGTPTAGGVLILFSFIIGVAALVILKGPALLSPAVLLVLGVLMAFGSLGFVDDYLKISKKKNKGVSGYTKLAVQVIAGLVTGWFVMQSVPQGSQVSGFGLFTIPLGYVYPLLAAFIITGASNAVNLTDGLDGLASATALLTFITLALMLFAMHQVALGLLSLCLAGAALGFLMFNRNPARIFMGDTGSLALGGAFGALVVLGKLECWALLLGAIFIVETLSVILQVYFFKTTGKRIFRMSPLHHHFELGGWSENRVVYSFVTFQFFCCTLAVFLYNFAM